MNCISCGSSVPSNASFCPHCGTFVGQPQPTAQAPQPQQFQPQQPFSDGAGSPTYAQVPSGGASAPTGQPNPAAYAPGPNQPVYAQGCIAAAWKDVSESPNWLSRTTLLGIIQCVPILNFFALGYALNWSREVPFGGKSPLPKTIFSGGNFEIGFYAFVIMLAFSLVGGIGAGILGIVPIIGGLAGVALGAGLSAMAYLCCVRMGMKQRFGAGFELGEVWRAIMRNPGSFLAAALLPIIASCVMVALVTAVGGLLGAGSVVPMLFFDGGVAMAVFALVVIAGSLLLYVACCMLYMVATLVTDRALAHWVGRYAPEWTLR